MSEKNRIEKILQYEGLSIGQFAQEIGIKNSTLSHILNERNKPSLDVIKKILARYTNINSEWLIFGQGSMFKKEGHSQEPKLFEDDDVTHNESDIYPIREPQKEVSQITSIQEASVKSEDPPVYNRTIRHESRRSEINSQRNEFDELNNKKAEKEISIQKEYIDEKLGLDRINDRNVTKIIIYYSDNTFQEFDSK